MPNLFAVLLLTLVLGLGGPVHAQFGGLTDTLRRIGVTQADIDLMYDTAAKLYRGGTPKVGRTLSWTNADTEAKGSVKLVAFRSNCAYLQHFIITTRQGRPQEYRSRQCKSADGNWVLTP